MIQFEELWFENKNFITVFFKCICTFLFLISIKMYEPVPNLEVLLRFKDCICNFLILISIQMCQPLKCCSFFRRVYLFVPNFNTNVSTFKFFVLFLFSISMQIFLLFQSVKFCPTFVTNSPEHFFVCQKLLLLLKRVLL